VDIFQLDPNNLDADADGFLPGVFNTFRSSLSPDGLIGGVQGGYNWQSGSMVFGIEGDVSFADWGHSSATFDSLDGDVLGLRDRDEAWGSASADVDMLASVRGRVGFAMDSLLIYGTGGVAWADADARATVVHYDASEDETTRLSRKRSFNDVGFVLGGGVGWMVIPQTFSVGVEGLYYFFDERKTLINETIVLENQDEIEVRATASLDDAWVIRARADFHF
jgi:outer membrane immunogenic protein